MFTGIVTAMGKIAQVQPLGASAAHGLRLHIETPAGYLDDVGLGDSIALNGACMTAVDINAAAGRFAIDISAEALARTAGLDHVGPVNLEKALRANDRLVATSCRATWMAWAWSRTLPRWAKAGNCGCWRRAIWRAFWPTRVR